MLGLLGKKLGQTSVYNAQGVIVPVTIVLVGPNRVIQTKTVKLPTATTPSNWASTTRRNTA